MTNERPKYKLSELTRFTDRQKEAARAASAGVYKFILYGGAMGGGKSYFLRWFAIRHLMYLFTVKGISNAAIMLACEDYPSLADRQLSKIEVEFPAWLGKSYQDHKVYRRCFVLNPEYGSGVICFRNLDDPSKYASSEFAAILVDELTKNTFEVFNHLRTRLRWPGLTDIECLFLAGTNPGSIGHGWVKQLWMDSIFPEEFTKPVDYRPYFKYIPSKADDNPHLDATYWNTLSTLPENMRKAFRDGDWNIFLGQAFPEFGPRHQIHPIPIPDGAPLYMTFDWGHGKPFSIGWWWVDADGRVYRFSEWYGFTGAPDTGLQLADSQIAEGIKERERDLKITDRSIIRLAGPDCWSKKPRYDGTGKGPSTAEVFLGYNIILIKGDPARNTKIRQFRERLRVPEDGNLPMMVVYDTCTQFVRTVPALVMDKNNIEDVDTTGEDHIYDEACHICMARPIAMDGPPKRTLTMFEKDMLAITGVDPRDAEQVPSAAGQAQVWLDDVEESFERDRAGLRY